MVASAILAGSCERQDPTRVERPPVVRSFAPTEQHLDAFVGDTLRFEVNAFDPDRTSLKQRYTLNDSVVSDQFKWTYVVTDTGLAHVQCVVTDGAYSSRIRWEVAQHVAVNYPPVIVGHVPAVGNPSIIIGYQLEFAIRANDPEGEPLHYEFFVDDSVVATESEFVFEGVEVGVFDVEASVSDGEHSASQFWQLTVTPVPDTIPPAEVIITLTEKGDNPGEVRLEWISVGADGTEGVASNYLVRTSPAPINDEDTWIRATPRPDVPAPVAAGETMAMVIEGLTPGRFTHVAVRAEDEFGNLSPLGSTPGLNARGMRIAGKVMDAITGLPMPDIHVNIVTYRTTTDGGGEFELVELPPLDELLIFSDDNRLGILGTHYDLRLPYQVVHQDYLLIYLIPDYQLETGLYTDFYSFYVIMTKIGGSPYPNHQRRWEAPIALHALPFEKDGLDYQATIHQNALDLNTHIGRNLFNVVDGVPDVGVFCEYSGDLVYDNYGVLVWSGDWYPVRANIEFRTVYSPASIVAFNRVIRHELGHALGLNHSEDWDHLMVGGVTPQVDTFSPDELAVIRVLYHVPRGTAISHYIRE